MYFSWAVFRSRCYLALDFIHERSDKEMRQQMLKTRAQVLWLEGTFDFQQHSDVTFQMHPYHSVDGGIDPAPFQVWGGEEGKKKKTTTLSETAAFAAFEKSAFVPGNSYQSLVFLFICLFLNLKSLLGSD